MESTVAFSGYNFKFYNAGNYTANVIQAKTAEFYLYNSDSLGMITSIVMTLRDAHTTHEMYGGVSANPTTTAIVGATTDSKVFTYDFTGSYYSYFRLFNTLNVMYISSIVINFMVVGGNSSLIPSSSSQSSSSSSSSSSSQPASSSFSGSAGDYGYYHVDPTFTGTYYNTVSESLRDNTLLLALDQILDADAYTGFSYNTFQNVYIYTDVETNNANNLIGFYSGTSAQFSGSFSSGNAFNREHVWPASRGGTFIDNDPHMARPTLVADNSSRGNSFYNEGSAYDPASLGVNKYRGIAARIIMYCAVKAQENGLHLVDLTTEDQSNLSMGKLSSLLMWNLEYPVDATEIQRNDALVAHWGHCRNPFIDDRNYGCKIWGSTNATTKAICGM